MTCDDGSAAESLFGSQKIQQYPNILFNQSAIPII